MDDLLAKMKEELKNNEDVKDTVENIDDGLVCLLEAIASDDEKILNMGETVAKICTEEQFSPFEICSMCCTLITSAVTLRAEKLGVSGARVFFKSMMSALEETIEEELKEMEDGSKDGDCSCKCE